MARPRGNNKAVCQNENCSFFRKEKGKDITRQGKNYAGHQRFLCKHCGVVFVETKGTPLYNRKLNERKIKAICTEFVETEGIRATERKVHVHRDTVSRLLNDIGQHALVMTNFLVHDLKLSTYEVDEILVTIKKNRKNLSIEAINSLEEARLLLQQQ